MITILIKFDELFYGSACARVCVCVCVYLYIK